jgi:predicted amidophosphoribosyltransferase
MMPGPFELLILAFLAVVFLLPVALLVLLALTRLKGPATVACPKCRRRTVPGANFCHHCGQPLA